jgi:hypothetical protein
MQAAGRRVKGGMARRRPLHDGLRCGYVCGKEWRGMAGVDTAAGRTAVRS